MEDRYVAGNPGLNGSNRLIVVSGCSGGGKSTLLEELARRGYPVQPEPGRQIVKEQLFVGGDGLPWAKMGKFLELCLSRAMYLFNTARPSDRPAVFDRSIVDVVTACARLGLPRTAAMTGALKRYRYARRVFLAPPWEELFQSDAERRHTFAEAVAEYEALVESYRALGYEIVLLPKLSVAARADFFEARIRTER